MRKLIFVIIVLGFLFVRPVAALAPSCNKLGYDTAFGYRNETATMEGYSLYASRPAEWASDGITQTIDLEQGVALTNTPGRATITSLDGTKFGLFLCVGDAKPGPLPFHIHLPNIQHNTEFPIFPGGGF